MTRSTAFFTNNSDPCQILGPNWTDAVFHHVQTDSLPAVFVGSTERVFYFRLKFPEQAPLGWSEDVYAGAYLYDGTNYLVVGLEPLTFPGNARFVIKYGNTQSVIGGGTITRSTSTWMQMDKWGWVKVVINADDSIDFYRNITDTTIKPTTWTLVTDLNLTHDMNTITEMGVFAQANVIIGDPDQEFLWDDMELVVGEGNPIDNSVIDGDTVKVSSLYAKKTLGQVGGSARLTYHDPLRTLGPTVETAHRTVTTISETQFNTRFIQGEVTNTDTMAKEIIVSGIEQKLARKVAAYNPVYTQGVVEYIQGNTIYKQNSGKDVSPVFSSYGSLVDKLIVFIKNNPRRYLCGAATAAPVDVNGNGIIPDKTDGSINNLFFSARKEIDANSGLYFRNDGDFYVELTYEAIIKDSSTIDKAELQIWWSISSAASSTSPAKMQLWDYTNSVWRDFTDSIYEDKPKDPSHGWGNDEAEAFATLEEEPRRFSVSFKDDITTGVFADYSSVSAANTYGWKTHTFKIRLYSTDVISNNYRDLIHIWKTHFKFDLDIDQQYQVGVGKIQTVNDHNLVLYGNAAVSWLDEDVRDDGIGGGGLDDDGQAEGDAYFITDKISDILTALWSASGIDLIVNLNVSLTTEIPDIEDLRRVMILAYVQKISELLGAIYWTSYTTDPVNDLPTFFITDNPTDSGLILTDADFIEPMEQTTYKIDSSKELSTLKLIGKDGLIGTVSITPEHTAELGLESIQISRPDLETQRQAASWLSKKKLLYTSAYRYFSCRINYDRALQDYSLIDLGLEVSVKNPTDASIVDHQSGTNGRLLIYQMELNRNWSNGYSNYITLILQQRFE